MCMDVMLKRKNISEVADEQYKMMKGEKFYGVYMMGSPQLVFMDPEWAKQVGVLGWERRKGAKNDLK